MTSQKKLLNFIIDARKRGYSDAIIIKALEKNRWSAKHINSAFEKLRTKPKIKNQVCIFLSDEILKTLEKRAKKNLFNVAEQIEDILRRSCARKSTGFKPEKLDDALIGCFSRSNRGRRKKR